MTRGQAGFMVLVSNTLLLFFLKVLMVFSQKIQKMIAQKFMINKETKYLIQSSKAFSFIRSLWRKLNNMNLKQA